MIKRLMLALAIFLSGTEAVMLGPYDIIIDLPGFNATNQVGPIKGSEGVDHVSYMMGFNEGGKNAPSDAPRRFSVDVTKFGLPIDIDNKNLLDEAYRDTVSNVYPGVAWDEEGQVMIDKKLAAHGHNLTDDIHFICYFMNPNEKVTLGTRNLTEEEFTQLIRGFHVQKV